MQEDEDKLVPVERLTDEWSRRGSRPVQSCPRGVRLIGIADLATRCRLPTVAGQIDYAEAVV